jgi:hypothetical protein
LDCRRGRPFSPDELATFKGNVDYGGERLAKDRLNDDRYAERKDLRPFGGGRDLIDVVIDVVASSNRPTELLAERRAQVERIMSKPCNRKYKPTAGMSDLQERHQTAIRLVHALAFDGITQARFCRRHRMRRDTASRLLDHICEREPGLREALNAISACARVISWQKEQQKKAIRLTEREAKLVFGWNRFDVDAETYPSQASVPRKAFDGEIERSAHLSLIPDECADGPTVVPDAALGGFTYAISMAS